jgi:hypothetical protein
MFYRMSADQARQSGQSAERIASSVDRLETIFGLLYSDTFSMMRDTVSDMRRHIWPTDEKFESADEMRKQTDERFEGLQHQVAAELRDVTSRLGANDDQMRKLLTVVDNALKQSREVETEALRESARDAISSIIKKGIAERGKVYASRVVDEAMTGGFSAPDVISQLEEMRDARLVNWDGELGPLSEIYLTSGSGSK